MLTRFFIFVFSVIVMSNAWALKSFNELCPFKEVQLKQHDVVFFSKIEKRDTQRLYAINNVSSYPVWLTHERQNNPGVGAGWSSQVLPGRWSVLVIKHNQFDLSCHRQHPDGTMHHTSCRRRLRVCQFTKFTTQNPIVGTYWVVENEHLEGLLPHLIQRGFTVQ